MAGVDRQKVDDVYLCESVTGGDWKVSHHNEWKSRIAMTKERAESDGVDRVVAVEWRDEPEHGWSEGAGLLIPCAYLRESENPLKVSSRPGWACRRLVFQPLATGRAPL